jgi:hypothetical protein
VKGSPADPHGRSKTCMGGLRQVASGAEKSMALVRHSLAREFPHSTFQVQLIAEGVIGMFHSHGMANAP